MKPKFDSYQAITDKLVAMIEAGAGEWKMPWHTAAGERGLTIPRNVVTGKAYRGLNVALLWGAGEAAGYSSQLWATYKQWGEKGAQVRKGEKATLIFFWKRLDAAANDDDGVVSEEHGRKVRMVVRTYSVFAAEQVDGYDVHQVPATPVEGLSEAARIANAEAFFTKVGAVVRHGGNRAFYAPSRDAIQMPNFAQFKDAAGYYATLGHEHAHWTGHEKRLDRSLNTNRFGDEAYAFEELVAEISSAILAAELGIANEPRPDHAAYLASWLKVLKNDKRAIFTAASKAQAAVDYLLKQAEAAEAAEMKEAA